MHEDLRSLILGVSGLSALVGTRVTWNARPQGSALPAIVLWLVGEARAYAYDGGSYVAPRVQMDIWAATYADAIAIDRLLEPALSGFRGTQGDTEFMGILFDSRRDSFEEAPGAQWVHRITRDLIVHHKSA